MPGFFKKACNAISNYGFGALIGAGTGAVYRFVCSVPAQMLGSAILGQTNTVGNNSAALVMGSISGFIVGGASGAVFVKPFNSENPDEIALRPFASKYKIVLSALLLTAADFLQEEFGRKVIYAAAYCSVSSPYIFNGFICPEPRESQSYRNVIGDILIYSTLTLAAISYTLFKRYQTQTNVGSEMNDSLLVIEPDSKPLQFSNF